MAGSQDQAPSNHVSTFTLRIVCMLAHAKMRDACAQKNLNWKVEES